MMLGITLAFTGARRAFVFFTGALSLWGDAVSSADGVALWGDESGDVSLWGDETGILLLWGDSVDLALWGDETGNLNMWGYK